MNFIQQRHYNEICTIVQSKGGKILSDRYINTKTHVLVECQYGHQWMATPSNLKTGYYCRTCMTGKHNSKEKFLQMVELKGGKILGNYVGNDIHVHIVCEIGHNWMSTPCHIKEGHWCPDCADTSKMSEVRLIEYITKKMVFFAANISTSIRMLLFNVQMDIDGELVPRMLYVEVGVQGAKQQMEKKWYLKY